MRAFAEVLGLQRGGLLGTLLQVLHSFLVVTVEDAEGATSEEYILEKCETNSENTEDAILVSWWNKATACPSHENLVLGPLPHGIEVRVSLSTLSLLIREGLCLCHSSNRGHLSRFGAGE